jgi:hypothetical protein
MSLSPNVSESQIHRDPVGSHQRLNTAIDMMAGDRFAQDELPDLKKKRLLAKDIREGVRPG